MPFYDDHPVRVLLKRSGLTRFELARAAGITYGALDKLMMGMTKTAHPEVVKVLAKRTATSPKDIRAAVKAWNEQPFFEKLPPRARATLALGAGDIVRFYPSFQDWREEFAENPTQFASILRIPRATLVEWETGRRKVFPPSLAEAIVTQFHVPAEYAEALAELPPSTAPGLVDPTARIVQLTHPLAGTLPAADEEGDDGTE